VNLMRSREFERSEANRGLKADGSNTDQGLNAGVPLTHDRCFVIPD
jgi:hypothetical protein